MKRIQPARDTASVYQAEPEMVRIAAQRTRAIVRAFMADAAWKPIDFMVLAESCYMQGLHDMCDAATQAQEAA